MIYLKDGNTPLNEAWADEIYQEGNSTYQLTFKYPFSSDKWKLLTEETELIADDLHGEQEFTIFEVVKEQGYITVYANQIATLLKYHSISSINVDRVAGNVVMTELAGAILRDCPFSFYSDITEKHTFNAANISVMDALIKEKHSIVGQWGGDLVRDKYQVSLLKNGGSETEALFMYKKNMRSPQQTTSTKELRTRIHFRKKIEVGEGDNRKEQWLRVTVDSPLISKYKHIYEDDMEVTDEDVKDLASLTKYGEQYYRTTLCDMIEDSLELDVAGVGDVPVKIFDVVSVYHEQFEIDVRKKITKYRYSPMGKRLKSVGFGTIQQTLGGALSALVSDSVKAETAIIEQDFEVKLEKELKNADKVFDQKMNQMEQSLSDEIEQARAKAEEVKAAMTEQLNLKINQNKSEVTEQLKSDFDRKLSNAQNELAGVRANLTQAQSQLSGDIGQIRSDVGIIRAKQGEAESELTKQVQALNQTKAELAGVKTNLTQAQSQLTSNIAQIRSDVGNIRTKQSQAEADLAKQVSALNQTKTELAGVKSAQANYEQTTTRRLAELANVADGKASKSELVQTAEELKSRIASVQASGRNLFLNSLFKQDIRKTGIWTTSTYTATIDSESKYLGHNALKIVGQDPTGRDGNNPKITYPATGQYGKVAPGSMTNQDVTISFYAKAEKAGTILRSRLGNIGFKDGNVTLTTEVKRYVVKFSMAWTGLSNLTTNEWLFNLNRADTVWIWMPKFEVSDTDTPYSEAPEDIENQISAVESSFKQKADSLEAGVNRLTEGLKTKADSSALNLLSDSIKQSVKSLETDTQNKLSQKLSTAEFEVQASGIRQEILNATKDKADKTLVTAEAGKLREELASLQVGGRNLLKGSKGPFKPNRNPSNFDNNVLYHNETSIYMVNGQRYRISAKTDGTFTSHHDGFKESDNVVLWIMDKAVTNYQIVSDAKTGTTGTEFVWSRPTGTYHLRVNTYRKDPQKLKSVWEAKVEQGSFKTDWSPAPEDTDGLITEAKAVFERTAQGLRVDLTAVQAYVSTDSTRAEALRTYSREETARQLTAERKLIDASYVGKAQHTEDVKGISRRFEELNSGGPNLVSNGATELGLKNWLANGKLTADHKHPFFKNGTATMFVLDTTEATIVFMQQNQYNVLKRNTDYTLSFTAFASSNVSGFRALVGLLSNTDHAWKKTLHTYTKSLSPTQAERITVQFNSGDYDGFALRFDNMGSSNGRSATVWISEIDVYEGAMKRPYQPSPVNGQSYADTKLAEYKQGIDGQLANVQSALNTANGSLTSFNTWKQSAQETLNKVGRVETGLNETKTSLAEFKQTAQGLRVDLTAVQAYVSTDSTRAEALRTYSREETARQLTAERKLIDASYVGKAQHTEDVKGISRRFEELNSGGPNLVSNGATELGLKNWLANGKLTADHKHPFFKNGTATMFVLDTTEATIVFMQQNQYNVLKRNTDYTLSFTAFASSNVSGFRALVGLLSNTDHAWKKTLHTYTKSLSPTQAERITVQFNSGDYDGFALRFDNMGSSNGRSATVWISEIDVYEGAMKRPYQPSPVNGQSYADTKLAEYKQGIDGQLANVQSALNTANGSLTSFNTWKQSAQETLNKVGRVETGLNETKTSLAEFKQTAQGLRTDLSAVQAYVNTDGSRAEALRTFSREETARQMTALRQSVEAGYVAKAQHTEDVRGLTRRFEELKSSSETKLAEFRQGIDGQFATISSQISETIKKTDISITPGQITLGTGKVVNGQTLASLFVQNPESMEAITKLMRITGDLIVDGSITGRDLAAGAITTPHLAAGAVTAEVLGANAVTADKVKADDALLEKLSAGEALLRKLMAKDAFINRLQSIDFTAEQIKGGLLRSIDGSLIFDLNKNTLTMSSNTAAIKRVLPGHPTQFMRYETERKGNVDYTRTIIGSNRNGSEKFDSVTFAGLVVENSNKAGIEDSLRLYGDNTYFRHAQGEVGWNINAVTQRMAPATWQKESAIWARNFVVPKHRTPNGRDWVKLEETVAALWRLWEHAAGNQVTMTGAMRDKVRELFQNYGYNYGIS